jgi:hypothetical protein
VALAVIVGVRAVESIQFLLSYRRDLARGRP